MLGYTVAMDNSTSSKPGFARRLAAFVLAAFVALFACGCQASQPAEGHADAASTRAASSQADAASLHVEESGSYTSKDEVALYIHEFGRLPGNFISKTKARKAGWVASEGNLDEVCPGKSIGGSVFYNDDGALPEARGRTWTECDIGYSGGFRGAERIVFSNDGLVYYTGDHYKSFERLY